MRKTGSPYPIHFSLFSYRRRGMGYNRDHEKLPPINLCLIMGESVRFAVYQRICRGSLKDESTLDAVIAKFEVIADPTPMPLVMEKGFYSTTNVNCLLKRPFTQFAMPDPLHRKLRQEERRECAERHRSGEYHPRPRVLVPSRCHKDQMVTPITEFASRRIRSATPSISERTLWRRDYSMPVR